MHNDREFILKTLSWPNWPILPLKRKNNSLEDKNLGILFDTSKYIIYHIYMYDIKDADLKNCPKSEYKTLDDLLADGWVVD